MPSHSALYLPGGKLDIDAKADVAKLSAYTVIVVERFM